MCRPGGGEHPAGLADHDNEVGAFADSERPLVMVGKCPEAERIRRIKTPNMLMMSDLSDSETAWWYWRYRAPIAASYEGDGPAPIAAGVWGRPTIPLRWGGYLDTVDEGVTEIYFYQPEPVPIAESLDPFEASAFGSARMHEHVEQLAEERSAEKIYAAADGLMAR